MIAEDRRFPIAHDEFGITLDKGFARDGDPVRPAMGFGICYKIVELIEPLLQKRGDKRVGHDRRVSFPAQKGLPRLSHRAVLITDFPVNFLIGIDARFAQLVLEPHSCNPAFVPISNPFPSEVSDGLDAWARDKGSGKPVTPAADDADLVVTQTALRERRAHVDIRYNVDPESDHVAHNGADFIVSLAIRSAGLDCLGIDLGVDDLHIQAFPGKQARLERKSGGAHVSRMPAAIADA